MISYIIGRWLAYREERRRIAAARLDLQEARRLARVDAELRHMCKRGRTIHPAHNDRDPFTWTRSELVAYLKLMDRMFPGERTMMRRQAEAALVGRDSAAPARPFCDLSECPRCEGRGWSFTPESTPLEREYFLRMQQAWRVTATCSMCAGGGLVRLADLHDVGVSDV